MVGALIGRLAGPIMPYLLGGAVVAVMVISGLYYWKSNQYDKLAVDAAAKIERAEHNAVLLNRAITAQEKAMADMLAARRRDQENAAARDLQLTRLQKSLDEERRQNDDYKNRWAAIALKKPTLLARHINRAVAERVRRIASTTCRADCDGDGDQDNSGEAPEEAKPDPGS
tara:strand:+ start:3240 stop:3752 length:513 start_codon:yes stop_codon:yes gene_type:complete